MYLAKELEDALVDNERLRSRLADAEKVIAPFANVGKSCARRTDYPDDHIVSVSCDVTKEMGERMQQQYDSEIASGNTPPWKRPSELNWPKECLALDSVNVGHFRAARAWMEGK